MAAIKRGKTQGFHDYRTWQDFDAIVIRVDGSPVVMIATDIFSNEETERIANVVLEALERMYTVYKGLEDSP